MDLNKTIQINGDYSLFEDFKTDDQGTIKFALKNDFSQ